jgi:hypothetical protein
MLLMQSDHRARKLTQNTCTGITHAELSLITRATDNNLTASADYSAI